MNKHQFIEQYCQNSNFSADEFNERFVAMPCNCGDNCNGWACVVNTPLMIWLHINLTLINMGHESKPIPDELI